MSSQAVDKRREALSSMCDERARMLQDQFNVSMNHLQALAILVSTFHHSKNPSAIDQMTFARYAERTAFERPLTSGVAYAVRVTHAEREQFERQQGWSIKKMYSSKKQSPGPGDGAVPEIREPAEEYAPVIFAQDAYKHVISFDMLSGHNDRENILASRKSGKGVLTAPFKLLNNRLGVISTYTVYKSELPANARPHERIQAAIGYLGGIFDIEALVDKLLHQLAGKQSIMVNVYDTTNESPISMYGSNDTGNGMCHVSMLNFGDPSRKHEMHCRFMQKATIAMASDNVIIRTLNSRQRAEDADIAKSQFLATVSHEIRTPMNGVLGMLQMLMDTDLDTMQQDYVRTAQASGKTLVSLINEVLDQAKIESGKLELEAVPFDLRTVCDDIVSLFCGKAQEKGLELAVYVSDQVPPILIGDPGRMRQIITNLVGNSIKFTERGHIYLTVHVIEEVMSCLEVETGIQNTNTLSGYPVGPSIARIHGGTGIGLSISKCLVGLMKGEIGFASKPYVGSTFTFTAVLMRAHCKGNEIKLSEFKGINALVVDHRPVRAKWLLVLLRSMVQKSLVQTAGKKAITLLKPPHIFDACFMDIQMPEMDGFEATKRIRVMERDLNERIERGEAPPECASIQRWRTPILAMTADVYVECKLVEGVATHHGTEFCPRCCVPKRMKHKRSCDGTSHVLIRGTSSDQEAKSTVQLHGSKMDVQQRTQQPLEVKACENGSCIH
ncbi:hypothetical protein GUJ93_ZPchr0019g2649 [Zizania palustris]|uniref:histidine kinase n=1 Tax=Zizania palustris TaxID=103762 RepID=A0A8J5TGZ3_ZIZPA|nr:hypothetical protein GUJ93_ZPchr0019g2649 [Zizania palustris]